MLRTLLKSKIHRLRVTDANVEYEGSVTLDQNLLEAADILPNEQVHIWNVTRGSRLVTYALVGESGSGVCCVNGAAAHHAGPGDIVIVATFAQVEDGQACHHMPRVLFVDEHNRVRGEPRPEVPGPRRRVG